MAEGSRRFFTHSDKPEWGVGVLVDERDGKRTIDWQHGKRHVIAEPFWAKLVESSPDERAERQTMAANETITRSLEPKKAKKARKGPAPVLPTWEGQLARFKDRWPGGFADPTYQADERAGREASFAKAAALMAGAGDPEPAKIKEVLQASQLLHPVEIARMANNPAWVAPMRELLSGGGDPLSAFDAVITALGAKPTWTMATVVPALVDPANHVFIKPGLFQTQAKVAGRPIENYSPTPSGSVYVQFQDMSQDVGRRLAASGMKPKDLLDVHMFVWRTLSPVKAANGAPIAAAAPVDDDD